MPVRLFGFALVFAIFINVLVMQNGSEVIATGFQLFDSGYMGLVLRVENCAEFAVTEFLSISHLFYLLNIDT